MLITIGSFDGFHKGHAELLRICRENSKGNDWGVVTFWPHPSEFLNRLDAPLFTLSEREIVRRVLDIPNMFVLRFDERLRDLSPKKFWELLRERLCVDGLVMGSDFHFGYEGAGSAEYLGRLARYDGLDKIIIAELLDKGRYSSSNVRHKIITGDPEGAYDILGYHWFMMSGVIHGNERGRTMKLPTANLNIKGSRTIPAFGVYASAVLAGHEWHCGALSIGNNPTFHDVHEVRAEVHIMDFEGDIYDEELPVFLLGRVRDIKTFGTQEALISQINNDIKTCRSIYEEVMRRETQKFFGRFERIYNSQQKFIPEIISLI